MAIQDLMLANPNGGKKKKKPVIPKIQAPEPPKTEKVDLSIPPDYVTAVNPNYRSAEQRKQAKAERLQQALVQQTEVPQQEVIQQVTQPQVTDFSDELKQQSQAATNALVAELRNRINQAKQSQQQIIQQAPQQFDPLRAQSEVAKSQQLRTALERSSLLGDRGGIGRSEALATQTEGENRLNAINLEQQNVINQANAEIARLESQGNFEEARIRESQASQLLQNLMAERMRVEDLQRQDALRTQEIDRQDALRAEQQSQQASELKRNQFIQTLGRFSQDFTQQIQNVQNDGDPSNDWQIPILESARQEKIVSQNLDPLTGQPLPVDSTPELTSSSAINLWAQIGTANEAISRALGIPVGTTYTRQSTGGGGGTYTPESDVTYTDSNVTAALNTALGDAPKNVTNVGNWLIQNINAPFMTEQRFERLKAIYGITDADLEALEARRVNVNPSIGM